MSLECEVAGVKPIGKLALSSSHASVLTVDVCWFHEGEPLRVDGFQSISNHPGKNASSMQVLQPTPSKHQILLHQVLLGCGYRDLDAFDQAEQ